MNLKSIITVMALILIMFMAAIETSIISLALPTIKNSLNVGNLVSLVFTVYFIALVIANPIVGELMSRFKIIYFFNYLSNSTRFWSRSYDVTLTNSS